jgi:hypothetical protein
MNQDVCLDIVSSPSSFKCLVKYRYSSIVDSIYDVVLSCTWSLFRDCSCHIGLCVELYLVCLMLYKLVLVTFGKVSCMVL